MVKRENVKEFKERAVEDSGRINNLAEEKAEVSGVLTMTKSLCYTFSTGLENM